MNVTRENITCRKCRAQGIRNFKRGPVYLESGAHLDVISCRICSLWYSSRPLAMKEMTREVPPSENGHQSTLDSPCTVAGCAGLIDPAKNQSGLCNGCSHKLANWKKCGSKGLPPFIRTATGYMTRAAYLAAQPQESNHVEVTQELPRLAPPAPATPAVCHPPRRPPLLRRDDHESVTSLQPLAADWENAPQPAELAQLLTAIGLPVSIDVITCYWQPAERFEVKAFATAVQRVKSRRHVPPMPDVLVPIYDARCTAGRALS